MTSNIVDLGIVSIHAMKFSLNLESHITKSATFCKTSFMNAKICVSVPWIVGIKLCSKECNIA
jgi:hypothetical protein